MNLKNLIFKGDDALFPEGSNHIDFEVLPQKMCAVGYKPILIQPNKRCNDRFQLINGTLKLHDEVTSYRLNKYKRKMNFGPGSFCIEINGEAESKTDHFARICVKDNQQTKT